MTRNVSNLMTFIVLAGLILGVAGCASRVYPPQHQPIPPGSSAGSSSCGRYTGFLIFNNGGANYTPTSGTKTCVIQAQVGGAYLANDQYNVLWRFSPLKFGCAAPVAGSPTQKSFTSSPSNKYNFTLYFTGAHPPTGTDVALSINFK